MNAVVTPSSNWQGTAQAGSRWTVQQVAVLMERGLDPVSPPTATIARRAKVNPDDWTMPPPVERIELPRLALSRDGKRAKVVLPSGWVDWMGVAHAG